jgi:hypothetical protein
MRLIYYIIFNKLCIFRFRRKRERPRKKSETSSSSSSAIESGDSDDSNLSQESDNDSLDVEATDKGLYIGLEEGEEELKMPIFPRFLQIDG